MSITDNYFWTPLHIASLKGHTEITKLLLKIDGTDVNAKGA
jgi:ankyrin repeat protein